MHRTSEHSPGHTGTLDTGNYGILRRGGSGRSAYTECWNSGGSFQRTLDSEWEVSRLLGTEFLVWQAGAWAKKPVLWGPVSPRDCKKDYPRGSKEVCNTKRYHYESSFLIRMTKACKVIEIEASHLCNDILCLQRTVFSQRTFTTLINQENYSWGNIFFF